MHRCLEPSAQIVRLVVRQKAKGEPVDIMASSLNRKAFFVSSVGKIGPDVLSPLKNYVKYGKIM